MAGGPVGGGRAWPGRCSIRPPMRLIPAHFPKSPGMAIGLLGIGSGLGFFIGPQYAGWRAVHATWHFASVASWQKPCIELGAVGLLFGLVFLLIAREAPGSHARPARAKPLGRRLRWTTIAIALTLGAVISPASRPSRWSAFTFKRRSTWMPPRPGSWSGR